MPQNPQLFIYFQCSYLANYILKNFQKLLDFYIVSSLFHITFIIIKFYVFKSKISNTLKDQIKPQIPFDG